MRYIPKIEPIEDPRTGQLETPRKRVYTVWVIWPADDSWKIYFCPDCKTPIAQYKGDAVQEIPGGINESFPVMIQCSNRDCGRKIIFQAAVKRDEFSV